MPVVKPYFGLRRCVAPVRVLFGPQRTCSNQATRQVGKTLLCANHSKGEAMKVTIEFDKDVLTGTEAAKLVLAVKRSIDFVPASGMATARGSGPIVDEQGVVIGHWKTEHTRKRKAA
jgi:hypothetical protein